MSGKLGKAAVQRPVDSVRVLGLLWVGVCRSESEEREREESIGVISLPLAAWEI